MTDNTEVQEKPAGELQLNDIENAVKIIDVASRRGAFGANELSSVGQVFDRLTAFVAVHKPVPVEEGEEADAVAVVEEPQKPVSKKKK